jgi:hypothetical protein
MYCEFYEKGKNNASVLQTDLKTVRGYLNRAKNMCFDVEKIIIYYCSNSVGYYSDDVKKETINL